MWKPMVCGLAISLSVGSQAAEVEGYVLAIRGKWSVQGSRDGLAVGMPVLAGSRLVIASPAPADHIVVVAARSGAVILSRRCDVVTACSTPIAVSRADDSASPGSALGQRIERIFARIAVSPDRYAATLSRGSAQIDDRILALNDTGVDLDPLLAGLPEASYDIRLSPVGCRSANECGQGPIHARVEWRPSLRRNATIEAVAPGLYDMVLRSQARGAGPDRVHCWVLVLPAEESAAAELQYRSGVALAQRWGNQVDPEAKRTFTRGLLDALGTP